MSDQRKGGIAWTDETWNPIRGCSKVSAGCQHCYAETMAARFCGPGRPYEGLIEKGQWNGKVRFVLERLADPFRWRRPRRIFVNAMSDLFHESLSFEQIDRIFGVMAACWDHTFQVLTKRPARMLEYLNQDRRERWARAGANGDDAVCDRIHLGPRALPNVWLGVTVENQAAADERIPLLLQTPAALRWVSMEPLLGPVNLRHMDVESHSSGWCQIDALTGRHTDMGRPCPNVPRLDWVVGGGESGPKARPSHPDFFRSLRNQCAEAGVPFLLKQLGEWGPSAVHMTSGEAVYRVFRDFQHWEAKGYTWMSKGDIVLDALGRRCHTSGDLMDGQAPFTVLRKIGKETSGRLLDGQLHDAYPESAERGCACG